MQRIERTLLAGAAAVLCCLLGTLPAAGQSCTTTVSEASTPTVFSAIQTTETGFGSYFWEWGAGTMDQDGTSTNFNDEGSSDLAVAPGALWANVSGCSANPTTTGILVWAQTTDSGGKVALTMGSQNTGTNVDLDAIQGTLAGAQSIATTISAITVDSAASGNDGAAYTDYSVSWSAPSSTLYAVNDLSNDVLAGYAVYYRTDGPSNTGDPTGWTLLTATASSTDPFITDDGSANDSTDGYLPVSQTTATIRTRGSSTYWFALALRFDGTGAGGTDREADASTVEAGVVGPSSAGTVGPLAAGIVGLSATQIAPDSVRIEWRTAAEDGIMGFSIFRRATSRSSWGPVTTIPAAGQAGGGSDYSVVDQPFRPTTSSSYRLDVIGVSGSVLESHTVPVRLSRPPVRPPSSTGDIQFEGETSDQNQRPRPPQ